MSGPDNRLTKDQLEKFSTPRLLALYKSLRKRHITPSLVSSKDTLEYKSLVKSVLDTREHIDD